MSTILRAGSAMRQEIIQTSASLRDGLHHTDSPPTPLRFRRNARCQLLMTDNDRIGDISTIQTTPPHEIQLTAPIQEVQKMIPDHTTLTTLASHRLLPRCSEVFPARQVLRWMDASFVVIEALSTKI